MSVCVCVYVLLIGVKGKGLLQACWSWYCSFSFTVANAVSRHSILLSSSFPCEQLLQLSTNVMLKMECMKCNSSYPKTKEFVISVLLLTAFGFFFSYVWNLKNILLILQNTLVFSISRLTLQLQFQFSNHHMLLLSFHSCD